MTAANATPPEIGPDLAQGWLVTGLRRLPTILETRSRPRGGARGISSGVPSLGGEHVNQRRIIFSP